MANESAAVALGVSSSGETSRLRKRVAALEKQLNQAQESFRELADNIREVVCVIDPAAPEIVHVSQGYETLWERSRESLYADPDSWLEAVHPDDFPRVKKAWENIPTFNEEYRIVRRNGDVCWLRGRCTPILNGKGRAVRVVAFAEDITDWKRMEQQLVQSQKMDAVGRLAGGIAHDFNNLITVINGYSSLLMERPDIAEDMHEDLACIGKAGQRAAALTAQLLAFSRKQPMQPKLLDLNKSVSDLEPILRRLIRENVELVIVPGREPVTARADPSKIEQTIMNLVINARDAIEQSGTITVETGRVDFDEDEARLHSNSQAGAYAVLAVSDTGRGMSPQTQERIFEPFFTTKEMGQGTGLGLATVYGIVKQSGGTIWVYSELGVGSTFKIYLPLMEAPHTVEPELPIARPAQGSGTVLLVEDDEQVLRIAREALSSRGYRVIQAANGEEAIEAAARSDLIIDLLVTDVIMPKMGGSDLARRLSVSQPGIKVLYISGYTEHAIVQIGMQAGVNHLAKPFTPDGLLRRVNDLLMPKALAVSESQAQNGLAGL